MSTRKERLWFLIMFTMIITMIGWGFWGLSSSEAADPELQKSAEFIKKEMPGVSYEILEGAKAEGDLMFYHLSLNAATTPLVKEFEKRFPFIKVKEYFSSGGRLFQKFASEQRAKRYIADIWQNTDIASIGVMYNEGLLMNYKITSDNEYPASFKRSGFWYPICFTQVAVAWNPDAVPDEKAKKILKTWEGLADSYWKTKNTGALVIQSGGSSAVPWYLLYKVYGIDMWKKIAELKPNLYQSVSPMSDAVGSGEIDVGIIGSEAGMYMRYARGAPIHWAYPEPKVNVAYGQAIAKHAPHPNAAKLFQEFTFSKVGQAKYAENVLSSFRVGDMRKHAKEPWYHLPTNNYEYDMKTVHDAMRSGENLFEKWDKIFR